MSSYSPIIRINGVPIKDPATFEAQEQDYHSDDSGRSADGTMHLDVVATKTKIEISYNYLWQEEYVELSRLAKAGTILNITFPDDNGVYTTKQFYRGDRSRSMYMWNDGRPRWQDVKFEFIEI